MKKYKKRQHAGTLVRWFICIISTSLRRTKRIYIYIDNIFIYYIYYNIYNI